MIDVHMIDSGKFPTLAARQREAVKHPLITLQDGIFIHRNVREARRQSYLLGTNPYVSWIDDDDEVLDVSWIDEAVQILENDSSVAAVFPRYETYHRGKKVNELKFCDPWTPEFHRRAPPAGHHLTVMRRENVLKLHDLMIKLGPMNREQDVLLTQGMLRYGTLKPIDRIAYRWHLYPTGMHLAVDPPEVRQWAEDFTNETFKIHSGLIRTP